MSPTIRTIVIWTIAIIVMLIVFLLFSPNYQPTPNVHSSEASGVVTIVG
jgi:hypothetical protein